MSPPLVWTDLYGAVHALWRGLPGGHRWLVTCGPDQAQEVARQLPERFKGEVQLLTADTLTPLEMTACEWHPAGVLVVDRNLSGGPDITLPERRVDADGLSYREGGQYPAWTSALAVEAPVGDCPAAGAVAALGLPVVVCGPAEVAATLLAWWRATPHALPPEAEPPLQPARH